MNFKMMENLTITRLPLWGSKTSKDVTERQNDYFLEKKTKTEKTEESRRKV